MKKKYKTDNLKNANAEKMNKISRMILVAKNNDKKEKVK